jgi:hypothetical protein
VTAEGRHVAVASESALIVWDEKAKRQHFIRRAFFDTKAPYFGFLVPTPTQPELAEVPDEVFALLEDWTRPETRTETVYRSVSLLPWMGATLNAPLGDGVTVLDRQRVAGYDAVVLKATDAEALRAWLEQHGYEARPALKAWLEPYVKAGWVLTAFQIAKGDQTPATLDAGCAHRSPRAAVLPQRAPDRARRKCRRGPVPAGLPGRRSALHGESGDPGAAGQARRSGRARSPRTEAMRRRDLLGREPSRCRKGPG